MKKKEFASAALDPKHEIFVSYVMSLSSISLIAHVYPSRKPQIAGLITKEASTKIFVKYAGFANRFSPYMTFKLFEYIEINDHAIKLVNSQ